MTDRDEFAKAALIGFTSSLEGGAYSLDFAAEQAYEIADAMLRQREKRQVSSQENLTLTDEEREAIKEAYFNYLGTRTGRVLGGLLERLK